MAYHATCVCSGNAVYKGSPDVEVLASASHGVGTTCVTQRGTCTDIIFVEESETHVLAIKRLATLSTVKDLKN
jgi:hypothetical protein